MKNILFICLVILLVSSLHTHAQNTDTAVTKKIFTVDSDLLLKKSKSQKTVAWVLLWAGVLSTSLGSVRFNPDGYLGGSDNSRSTMFLVTGLAAVTASIPLFIASAKNKRKANLMVKNEPIYFNPKSKEQMMVVGVKLNCKPSE